MEVLEEIDLQNEVRAKTGRFRREFDERWSSLVSGRRHWKIVVGSQQVVILFLVFAIWDLARQSKADYYMIDRTGGQINYAGPLKPQNMDQATWDIIRLEQLKKFVSAWRTVTTDAAAQEADWDRAFHFVGDGSQAKTVLSKWYAENDPLKRAQSGTVVTVQFNTAEVEGANTYGIWWTETTTGGAGQIQSATTWKARIAYAVKVPTDPKAREDNPLGILATELVWEASR